MTGAQRRDAVFAPDFLEDLLDWIRTDRKRTLRTLNLVEATVPDPFGAPANPRRCVGILLVDGPAGSTGSIGSSIRSARSASTISRLGSTTDPVDFPPRSGNDTRQIVERAWSFAHRLGGDVLLYRPIRNRSPSWCSVKMAHQWTRPP